MNSTRELLSRKIAEKTARVGVIGLGYVGLPLLRAFIKAGFETIGYDIDQAKVDQLLRGESYIAHIPSDWIAEWLAARQFTATADMTTIAGSGCAADLRAHAVE